MEQCAFELGYRRFDWDSINRYKCQSCGDEKDGTHYRMVGDDMEVICLDCAVKIHKEFKRHYEVIRSIEEGLYKMSRGEKAEPIVIRE